MKEECFGDREGALGGEEEGEQGINVHGRDWDQQWQCTPHFNPHLQNGQPHAG